MKHWDKIRKSLICMMLALAMVLSAFPGNLSLVKSAKAEEENPVDYYYDKNGKKQELKGLDYTVISDKDLLEWGSDEGPSYYVFGNNVSSADETLKFGNKDVVTVKGTVYLILRNYGAENNGKHSLEIPAGIKVAGGASLIILGGGENGQGCTLTVGGKTKGQAGIGGDSGSECGSISIYGGIINATGGEGAAGIGGGAGRDGGNIVIGGGTVTATAGKKNKNDDGSGAGIGGGYYGAGGTITISGGTITLAKGTSGGAGIGGGYFGNSGEIIITGGTIGANKKDGADGSSGGAGIGGGAGGNCESITISGTADIQCASGGDEAAGIGGGTGGDGGIIKISGGNVAYAQGGKNGGAGIGGGAGGTGGTITITGGTIISAKGKGGGAGIGGGNGGDGGIIKISGGTIGKLDAEGDGGEGADGGGGGAGIGGGSGESGGTITISDKANIQYAAGGESAAGIGGGNGGSSGSITISGGTIALARNGNNGGTGIGGGNSAACGTSDYVSISITDTESSITSKGYANTKVNLLTDVACIKKDKVTFFEKKDDLDDEAKDKLKNGKIIKGQYHVTFEYYDTDGKKVTDEADYAYGTEADAITVPTPPEWMDQAKVYTFDDWNTTITTVTDDAVYTAVYSAVAREYEVKFCYKDANGADAESVEKYAYGTEADGITVPTPPEWMDEAKIYTFGDWDATVEKVTGDAVYNAVYSDVAREYEITFRYKDENGDSVESTKKYAYGTKAANITVPTPPERQTESKVYTFDKWDTDVADVSKDAVYEAVYSDAAREYQITFKYCNADGEAVTVNATYAYGTKAADIVVPTVPEWKNDTKIYTFREWDNTISEVTKDAVYSAKYDEKEEKGEYVLVTADTIKWTKGSKVSPDGVRIKRTKDDFKTVDQLDAVFEQGKKVDPKNYTTKAGSVIITLLPEYLETLSVGEHVFTAIFKDGNAVTFKISIIEEAVTDPGTPTTGDSMPRMIGILAILCAGLGMALARKRREE